jgi:nucleoside phosphorylase
MAEATVKEEIVMTPSKKGKTTSIRIEKVKRDLIDASKVKHKGQGQHSGLVINQKADGDAEDNSPAHLQLEFKCFLVDNKTGRHIPESRVLKFWFAPDTDYLDKVTGTYEFFKELVRPESFPRDYVGFIKRIMQMIKYEQYIRIKKIEIDMSQIDETEGPPLSPGDDGGGDGLDREDTRPREQVMQEQVLHTLESAYPNIMPLEDLAKLTNCDEMMVSATLDMLQGRNLIRQIEPGRWVRKVLDEKTEVKVVKNMPIQAQASKPTIAVITSKYNEKLAVDSMMENKTTYVKFKTEGESTSYTIGTIGSHTIVSTKIPQLGRDRGAQISSGNTTTRLLGTFSDIEHVLLVGVAGSVPHYTDFYKHTRLGDVIVGTPNQKGYMYIFCDDIIQDKEKGQLQYQLKSWSPHDMIIQRIFEKIRDEYMADPHGAPWEKYIAEGQQLLQGQEVDFLRPPPETDKLYMNIGGNDVIEVGHPPIPEEVKRWYSPDTPTIRHGSIGSGKPIIADDNLRQDFAARHNLVAYDTEFDQVLESIVGNRKDSFVFIRGVADYLDGSKNVDWQPYSALAAASFMKTLIESLPAPGYTS